MSIKTNFFDGSGISYGSSDLIAPWASLLTDGVFGSTALQVLAHSPANLSVDVAIGAANKLGYYIKSDSVTNVPIAANTSGYNRIDTTVLEIDTTNKITTLKAVQGIPSSSPVAPTLTSSQLALANVLIGNNVSVINQNVITDVRANVDLFGSQLATKASYGAGAWNGTIWGVGDSTGVTYTKVCNYVKIGNLVTVNFVFNVTAKGNLAGTVRIGGLPYVSTGYSTGAILTNNLPANAMIETEPGLNYLRLVKKVDNSSYTEVQATECGSTFLIVGSLSYNV